MVRRKATVPADGTGEVYEVESIIRHRRNRGKVEYFVTWKGYGREEDSWVFEHEMNAPDMVKNYINSVTPGQKTPPRFRKSQSASRLTGARKRLAAAGSSTDTPKRTKKELKETSENEAAHGEPKDTPLKAPKTPAKTPAASTSKTPTSTGKRGRPRKNPVVEKKEDSEEVGEETSRPVGRLTGILKKSPKSPTIERLYEEQDDDEEDEPEPAAPIAEVQPAENAEANSRCVIS